MIILDPDLDPDTAPQINSAKAIAPAGLSTRSLALFLGKVQPAVNLRGQVSVLLTTDAAIRKLNRQFRGKNKATDVLSFQAEPIPGLKGSEQPAGDLAISVDTARKQVAECGHSLGTELKVLMLHGLLHLAGYDHETDDGRMARRESALRAKFGLPLGLIERSEDSKSSGQRVGKSALSHPGRKNKDAARMGHPASTGQPSTPKRRPTAASLREATTLAQGGVRRTGRNPGKAPASRARRPVGPARKSPPALDTKVLAMVGLSARKYARTAPRSSKP